MTIQQPAQSPLTINDLINKVVAYLQNRSDASESNANPEYRPSAWIRDTLREITANYPFPELQVVGPLVTIGPLLGFGGSSYAYEVKTFLQPGHDMTLSEDPVIFLTPQQAAGSGLTPVTSGVYANTTSVVAYSMDYLTVKAIQPLLFIPGGVPFRYTRYGNQFWFGTTPGTNYSVYLPYQIRHPFADKLTTSPIRVPEDWLDIVGIGAAERGAVQMRWNDQASFLHNTLYGDPLYQSSGGEEGRPGLIAARILQPERDRRLSPVMVTPFAQRY